MELFDRHTALRRRALAVLGLGPCPCSGEAGAPHVSDAWSAVDECPDENALRYAYYRRMFACHPDRWPGDSKAQARAALVNEAHALLRGRLAKATLLEDMDMVREIAGIESSLAMNAEGLLSYEEWLQDRFFRMDAKSIWPY